MIFTVGEHFLCNSTSLLYIYDDNNTHSIVILLLVWCDFMLHSVEMGFAVSSISGFLTETVQVSVYSP